MEKKKILPAVIAVVLMALIIVGAVGVKLYEKYSYSKETMDLSRYYGIEKEVVTGIVQRVCLLYTSPSPRDCS